MLHLLNKYYIKITDKQTKCFLSWIDYDNINWHALSRNPAAIYTLKQNQDKINWGGGLSANPVTIHLLERNQNQINWDRLSTNPAAIHLLEQNQDKINWFYLSRNPSIFRLSCALKCII